MKWEEDKVFFFLKADIDNKKEQSSLECYNSAHNSIHQQKAHSIEYALPNEPI